MPDLPAGVYVHHKGHRYQALGYADDANGAARIVVVYIGLELGGAQDGPRLKTRDAVSDRSDVEAWWDYVHADGTKCVHQHRPWPGHHLSSRDAVCAVGTRIRPRFAYAGPAWAGEVPGHAAG